METDCKVSPLIMIHFRNFTWNNLLEASILQELYIWKRARIVDILKTVSLFLLWRRISCLHFGWIESADYSYKCSSISSGVFWMYSEYVHETPIAVAARYKAWTVFALTNAGIVGSNPTQGMDVCLYLFCVCVAVWVAALRRADSRSKESYRLCRRLRNWKSGKGSTKGP
jgi:hypothetical protein